ncbi:MAG: hypothetical protein ACLQD8_06800 [Thermoplasmata archaeon]
MTDPQETPAVPPFDPKGDERLGYFLAGGILIFAGWGVGVALNAVLHALAPTGGLTVLGLRVGTAWGPEGWAVAALGAFTGLMGAVLVALGRASPRGPVVLPGAEY